MVMLAVRLVAALMLCAVPVMADPVGDDGDSAIGYPSVDAALRALRAKPGVTITVQGGWTIAEDRAAATVWSFTPRDHAAYPAAVKRELTQDGTVVSVTMNVLCQAKKAPCDELVATFIKLNEGMKQSVARRLQTPNAGAVEPR